MLNNSRYTGRTTGRKTAADRGGREKVNDLQTAAGAASMARATEDMARLAQEMNRTLGRVKRRQGP